ncbi:helix-turn-helix transcriptional regulator [Vibrio viridaestus]|uniref:AraC family transcriptional regulator n=1 Tax=Vibrio viridaestus TaxID=2487322 RepID=A0A3N9TGW7_9VIBR|nr:helix-turn-helix domain-containing protein [Vibrio viridaestus]RQW63531.1 AraC family transcriptional regulator [Vibrio viridaestus]
MSKPIPSSFKQSALVHWVDSHEKQTLISETQYQKEALLEADLKHYHVNNGFTLHSGNSRELRDYQVISTAHKGLIVIILFSGKLDFSYDDVRFKMNADTVPKGLVVNLTKPATFRRTLTQNNQVSKINILLPLNWIAERLDSPELITDFLSSHLSDFELSINKSLLNLSQTIMATNTPSNLIGKLELETLVYQLFANIFKQMVICDSRLNNVKHNSGDQTNHVSKMTLGSLITYIETHLSSELTPKQLAQTMGMSESSLQRKFKQTLGHSVQSYIRRRRLEIARQHLERGVASVTEVAYNAGYRHPANFTNAFKKAFGYPPVAAVNKRL